ncbi:hypothetical protein C8F01DRAFT_1345405 [Mycena amicta]|nr:hypothetical protein C8F01DRAFT_1345405 [Mycena amicta]
MDHITNKSARRRILANIFHFAMKHILAPLVDAGRNGIEMASGDGIVRRCHPIFATFVGDYPEQVLAACVPYSDCFTCKAKNKDLENTTFGQFALRELDEALKVLEMLDEGPTEYKKACKEIGMKNVVHPFWEDLPYTNIFRSITPDVLHQLYQGVVKHLIAWIIECYGEAEIDARCRRLPANHNIRLFMKGISHLSRITGREHDQISRFLLGIIVDIPLPNGLSSALSAGICVTQRTAPEATLFGILHAKSWSLVVSGLLLN